MKILVVDDQAEAVGALARGLREATAHEVVEAVGGQQALDVSTQDGPPDVLVTEVVLEGVDGFALNESLRAARPELRTIYVTGYDLSAYADYINGTPVFYKPADPREVAAALEAPASAPVVTPLPAASEPAAEGTPARRSASLTDELPLDQRSQSSKLRHLVGKQGFTGKLDQFDLVDIIQMCCVSKRTGRLHIARREERGVLYLRVGQIIQAVTGQLEAEEAAYEIIGWSSGQFSFEDGVQPETQTITGGWEHLVMEGMRRRDERQHAATGGQPADAADPTLAGKSIGPYELRRKIGQGERSEVFEAVQTSMGRVVALKILLPEFQADDEAVQTFLAQASAKANVQHPSILSVYEAGQSEGIYYYTREFVDGSNLAYLHAQGRTIDDPTRCSASRSRPRSLSFLNQQKIPHPPLKAEDVYLGRDGRARVNNLAALPDEKPRPPSTTSARSRAWSAIACRARGRPPPGCARCSGGCSWTGHDGFPELGRLAPGGQGAGAEGRARGRLQAQRAGRRGHRGRQRRQAPPETHPGVDDGRDVRAPVAGGGRRVPEILPRSSGQGISTRCWRSRPANSSTGRRKVKASTGAFWIDEYEVTIGQYEQFLDALKGEADRPVRGPERPQGPPPRERPVGQRLRRRQGRRHAQPRPARPELPGGAGGLVRRLRLRQVEGPPLAHRAGVGKSRARHGRPPLPVGRRPDADFQKVNTKARLQRPGPWRQGDDRRLQPLVARGRAMTGDKSPYGVMDMAGNVSEWTATVEPIGRLDCPVVRGGSFSSDTFDVTRRFVSEQLPDQRSSDRVGFRTVSDSPPPSK